MDIIVCVTNNFFYLLGQSVLDMSFVDAYPHLHAMGVTTPTMLLSVPNDSDDDFALKKLNIPVVTIKAIIELWNFMNANQTCTYYTLWQWIACLFGDIGQKLAFQPSSQYVKVFFVYLQG